MVVKVLGCVRMGSSCEDKRVLQSLFIGVSYIVHPRLTSNFPRPVFRTTVAAMGSRSKKENQKGTSLTQYVYTSFFYS